MATMKTPALKRTWDLEGSIVMRQVGDGPLTTGNQTNPADVQNSNIMADIYLNVTAHAAGTILTIEYGLHSTDPEGAPVADTWHPGQAITLDGTVFGNDMYTIPIYNSMSHANKWVYRWIRIDVSGAGGTVTMDATLVKRHP